MKKLSIPEKHQLNIAKRTLRMPDALVAIAGGMNKAEAREFLKRIGWTEKRIEQLEK
jgi:hypothetical protein